MWHGILVLCNCLVKDVYFSNKSLPDSFPCRDDGGLVSCDLRVDYYSSGYNQLGLLLEDWLPSAILSSGSGIVLLGIKNDNGTLLFNYDPLAKYSVLRNLLVIVTGLSGVQIR